MLFSKYRALGWPNREVWRMSRHLGSGIVLDGEWMRPLKHWEVIRRSFEPARDIKCRNRRQSLRVLVGHGDAQSKFHAIESTRNPELHDESTVVKVQYRCLTVSEFLSNLRR
jgi:hypothetical protein